MLEILHSTLLSFALMVLSTMPATLVLIEMLLFS